MAKLTELEKQKAITCVGYIECKFRKALEHAKEMEEFYSNLGKKLRRFSNMRKYIAQEAINQYNEVKSVIEENKGKNIEELYEICSEKFHRNVFNFDGELFDIELDRIEATVMEINGVPTLLDRFDVDVSENFNGDWETHTVEDLQK